MAKSHWTYLWGIVLLAMQSCDRPTTGPSPKSPTLPTGWEVVEVGGGVVMGTRSYARSKEQVTDFVQIADISAGAKVALHQGSTEKASMARPSPSFTRRILADPYQPSWHWRQYASPKSFAMTNLQFFNFGTSEVSFPLKFNDTILSCGAANRENIPKRILSIVDNNLEVHEYPDTQHGYQAVSATLQASTAMVGLHPDAQKSPSALLGRTFLGYKDHLLIIYVSKAASQAHMKRILNDEFGIPETQMVMFDGSGSAQLICRGKGYILSADHRPVPSIIEILEN